MHLEVTPVDNEMAISAEMNLAWQRIKAVCLDSLCVIPICDCRVLKMKAECINSGSLRITSTASGGSREMPTIIFEFHSVGEQSQGRIEGSRFSYQGTLPEVVGPLIAEMFQRLRESPLPSRAV